MNTTKVGQERSLQRIFDVYLFLSPFISPINVGLSAVAVLYTSFSLFELPHNILMFLAGFFLTFAVYLLNVVTDFEEDSINKPEILILRDKKNIIIFISLASYILAISIGLCLNFETIIVMFIPFLIGFVYSVKIRGFRIKNLFFAKNVSISLSWAMEASLMPFIFKRNLFLLLSVFCFVFIKGMINTILFDLRDVEGDALSGVITVPVKMGRRNTFFLLIFLNSLLFLWLLLFYKFLIPHLIFILICIFYGYAYIIYFCKSRKKHNKLYSIIVDDEWLLWMLLVNFF